MEPRRRANRKVLESGPIESQVLEKALALPGQEQSLFVRSFYRDNPAAAEGLLRFLSRVGQLGSFLDGLPLAIDSSPARFHVGDVLENRFEILSFAGLGGMGEVYRVADQLSGEVLALKLCRESTALSGDDLVLLREEILLARRISNPHVCRIHELFATECSGRPTVFFTMEWLEGQTLAHHLSNDAPLSSEETISIAAQLAAGLDAVHRAAIVHRDLKPGNIFLVHQMDGSKRVVITDFGLAYRMPLNASAEASYAGQLAGTPEYMAPEQLLEGAVTPATDIYALALIVYEMAAGEKLYDHANFLQMIVRRVTEERPASLGNAIPEDWIAPIARALSKQPSDRYTSASAFVAALGRRQRGFELPLGMRVTRRSALGVFGALALSVSSFLAFSRFYGRGAIRGARPSLMLAPLSFSSGPKDLETLTRNVELLLRAQLNQSAYVTVLSRDGMERAWKRTQTGSPSAVFPDYLDPKIARQIALRSASPYVLYGTLDQTGAERILRLNLELVQGSVLFPKRSPRQDFVLREGRQSEAIHEASNWVRLTVGESNAGLAAHSSTPEELTTSNWNALAEYTAGDREWRAGRPGPAILHFKTALSLDDQFAAASTRLADVLMANGQSDDAYLQYAAATKLLAARNLTDRESLLGRGLFALDVGLNQEADDVFARYILEYPADPLPKFYRAAALEMLDRPDEAEALLSEAIRLAPGTYSFVMGRARHYIEKGSLDAAERDWKQGRTMDPNDWTDQFAMTIAFVRGDTVSAARAIARMRSAGSPEFQSKSFALEACLLGEQERWSEAETTLRRGLDFDRRTGATPFARSTKQRLLCQVYLSQGRKDLARCLSLEALQQAPGHETRLYIACLLAQTGDFPLRPDDLCHASKIVLRSGTGCAGPQESLSAPSELLLRQSCSTAALPAWPIYQYWQRRLAVELSMARKRMDQAAQIASTIPEPPARHIFPDHLLRIARGTKHRELEQSTLRLLTSRLGQWWLEPERNAPGFVQAATRLA